MSAESDRPEWGALFIDALTEPGKVADYYAAFHCFSLGNSLMAGFQLAIKGLSLTPIATFKQWKEKGRSVKKGEKALALCIPVTFKKKDAGAEDDDKTIRLFIFRNYWFSLEQTDGEPFINERETPGWDKDLALAVLGVTEAPFNDLDGNTQGYARPRERSFSVSPVAALPWKTRFHEIAHCLLHGDAEVMLDGEHLPKDMREAEAESVAYLCCASLGLPGAEYSRGYIQDWLGTPERIADFSKRSASRVFSAADKILKAGKKI